MFWRLRWGKERRVWKRVWTEKNAHQAMKPEKGCRFELPCMCLCGECESGFDRLCSHFYAREWEFVCVRISQFDLSKIMAFNIFLRCRCCCCCCYFFSSRMLLLCCSFSVLLFWSFSFVFFFLSSVCGSFHFFKQYGYCCLPLFISFTIFLRQNTIKPKRQQ